MASPARSVLRLNQPAFKVALRGLSTPTKSSGSSNVNANVPGLSAKCVNVPSTAVGPGAKKDGDYKNPEYYCYNDTSYFEAEVEMAKYRLPQPSSKKNKK
ncbi:uncharacterized protein LOC132202888 [Neocloeon triangulifer]|uniref:uncharacterized protein LOC132202888 n=1 Tax=Neocloeon triangulifer TaxID=2078957 RepID=UPI00286EBC9D|nr:uncharacterized protein LOC132202888 [Neocloeon triangulifer]